VEGKLEALADKIYERFVNRFFDDESESPNLLFPQTRKLANIRLEVFVDVQGDKYLARIVKTFPPRSLASSPLKARTSDIPTLEYHPLAANLSLDNEDVLEVDDPMKYFYSARLIVEGAELERGGGEEFEGSVMEVQADKIRLVPLHHLSISTLFEEGVRRGRRRIGREKIERAKKN